MISRNMQRRLITSFIRLLNTLDSQVPKRKRIHAAVNNYAIVVVMAISMLVSIPRQSRGL
jgi:hypothetical protein